MQSRVRGEKVWKSRNRQGREPASPPTPSFPVEPAGVLGRNALGETRETARTPHTGQLPGVSRSRTLGSRGYPSRESVLSSTDLIVPFTLLIFPSSRPPLAPLLSRVAFHRKRRGGGVSSPGGGGLILGDHRIPSGGSKPDAITRALSGVPTLRPLVPTGPVSSFPSRWATATCCDSTRRLSGGRTNGGLRPGLGPSTPASSPTPAPSASRSVRGRREGPGDDRNA